MVGATLDSTKCCTCGTFMDGYELKHGTRAPEIGVDAIRCSDCQEDYIEQAHNHGRKAVKELYDKKRKRNFMRGKE